ncbi:B-cell lymphoma/leukemia 11B, partial [Asbolus verrucosus]
PSNYVCCTCKARLHSAWRLVQHVQHSHGIKIYIESSPTSSKGSNNNNHSSSSASSSSSGCSSGGGPPPPPSMRHHLLPPPDLHNPFGVGGLLRLPLPPLNHGPVPPAPLFSRPEHHYRIDQLVSEQFRHHGLNLAAAAAAVAAQGVPPPHASFPSPAERAPSSTSVPSRERNTPNQPLSLEPQLDFYSQRSADAVHACEYCGKKFRYQNNLEVHRRTHTGELPYKCTVCDHACAQSSKLKRHMKIHRTPEDRTSNAGSVETLDGDESEDDDEVDEEEEEEDELEEEEAEDLSVPTQLPSKNANQSASLVGELMDKFGLSNIAQYSEAYKQALQESNSALKLQLASKDRDNNNSTSLSNQLKLRDEFAKSLLPGPPPQPLPLFPPFNDSYEASKRLKLDLERNDWWLPGLPRESKGLPGPSALLPNPLIKKETSRRNDTCEFCGKVFKNCSNLTVHRRSHTGEKPYKCELCSYACAQSSKLTRHMKTHGRIGKDVYRCRFCEMPFSVPSTLEKHMRKCVVNQGKGHLLSTMPMLSGDEDSSASIASKEAT